MITKKAIILGAGPIGLISAWKLIENGWQAEIFEKENMTGGTCKTWKWEDFLVDTGPHIYHTPDQELEKFWEKEFGDIFIKGDFWCKNVKGEQFNEYWDYPLSWESISRYPKDLKEKILGEIESLSFESKARAKNYKEYMEAQVGPTLRKMFFEKYPEKIWGISTEEMTPDWAPKRIEFRQKVTPFYHKQWVAVGKYGTGCVFDRIKSKVLALGGKINLNKNVSVIVTKDNNIVLIKFDDGTVCDVTSGDTIISSIPITELAKFLGYQSSLKWMGIRTVYLGYDKKQILPKDIHWFYYDSDKVFFHRVTEPKKMTSFIAPEGKTYLTCEITCAKGDEIYNMRDEELIDKVADQVELAGLAVKKDVKSSFTHREEYVYPLQYKGYQDELSKTKAAVSRFGRLYSLGTGGEFHYSDIQILFHKAFDLVSILCGKESLSVQTIKQTPKCDLNTIVEINGKKIGQGNKPYIIAEAGLNHNGSLDIAKKLVDEAKKAGCDAVKFQTFKASSRISKKIKAVRYAETIIGTEETLYDMFDRLAMSKEQQKELFEYANKTGIEVFSTPFDEESVDFLESLGVNVYKIASMDLVNIPLIKYTAKTGKPLIISTGMSTLGQIEDAVEAVIQSGNPNLILLHCNSSYPAAPEEMNLEVIRTLKKCFNIPVGLSDHTFGLNVSETAIALGADVIERHFTLDRMMEGPDHILSSEPDEMKKLVKIAKSISKEKAQKLLTSKEAIRVIGNGVKRIQPNEYDTLNTQRKSLYAAVNIKKGTVITPEMIAIKGPGGGLLPKYLDIVIGRKAILDIEEDYPINWSNI